MAIPRDDGRIAVSFFRDEEAVAKWRRTEQLRNAEASGHHDWPMVLTLWKMGRRPFIDGL